MSDNKLDGLYLEFLGFDDVPPDTMARVNELCLMIARSCVESEGGGASLAARALLVLAAHLTALGAPSIKSAARWTGFMTGVFTWHCCAVAMHGKGGGE